MLTKTSTGFIDDEFYDLRGNGPEDGAEFSTEALEDAQERFQRDRDLLLIVTIGLYALNIIDANVDAHLKQFNVSDDLSITIDPVMDLDRSQLSSNYGLSMNFNFK